MNSVSLKYKILFAVFITCLICGGVSVSVAVYYNNKEFSKGLTEKSKIVHGRLDEVAKYVAEQGGLKPMIERYTQQYTDSAQLTDEDKNVILQQVPIYAAMKVGSANQEKDRYTFRVFSNEPRNKNNAAEASEMEIFNKFEKDLSLTEIVSETDESVIVYRPIRLSESRGCLTCHGDPATSPWKNGKDILGYKMENWKDGKLHGVFAVKNDVREIKKAIASAGGTSSTTMLILFIMAGGALGLLIAAYVINSPLKAILSVANILNEAGNQVASAANEISSSSQDLSQAATEQASSLEETAASLEQITSMIAKSSESAKASAESSNDSHKKAEEGRGAVDQMLSSMDEISQSNEAILTQINESNRQMAEIVKVIQDIGTRTKVINEIVFQTKLLSFNASVEAARAGEHGKGFAVVAEEVGNLAQMSGNAAKEITEMLEASISKVENIVRDTQQKVETLIQNGKIKVEAGVEVAKQCSNVLNEIVQNVSRVSGFSQEIAQASNEQSQGVSEVNKAMNQLDTVTQQNAATSEQAASAAEELTAQADTLKVSIQDLMSVILGSSTENTETRTNPGVHSGKNEKPQRSNVVHLKKRADQGPSSRGRRKPEAIPMASGGDASIPSRDDDGFKDI